MHIYESLISIILSRNYNECMVEKTLLLYFNSDYLDRASMDRLILNIPGIPLSTI